MVFRLSVAAVGGVLGACQTWAPSNHLVRWIYTDRGLKWGTPIAAVLVPIYAVVGHAAQQQIIAGGSSWWWLLLAWSLIGVVKFVSVAVRTPLVWIVRSVRRRVRRRRTDRDAVA